jgi:hypothetical protein
LKILKLFSMFDAVHRMLTGKRWIISPISNTLSGIEHFLKGIIVE